jgi:hypothetical protein
MKKEGNRSVVTQSVVAQRETRPRNKFVAKQIMMRKLAAVLGTLLFAMPGFAQAPRLWVLRPTGEMVEYDPATFAAKQTVKLPADAAQSPQSIFVNAVGQILFMPAVSLPLSEEDVAAPHKIWLWNANAASTIDQGVKHNTETTGSNQAVIESAPVVSLSADGNHLFWFANQQRRLQREDVDLSTEITWQAWRTDFIGGQRDDLATVNLPDCRCPTGTCEESCPEGVVWTPDNGIAHFFLMTQFVQGKTSPTYKASARYQEDAGKWSSAALTPALQRLLDASSDGSVIVEAIPDTGCCGWSNQSNDQTLILANGKSLTIFDEQATYKNPDYDVSFYTLNAKLSPEMERVAMTIASTAQPNKPIQLAEQGQASPEESQRIRKALTELPAVEVKAAEESAKRLAFVPHATLIGWINEKEILIIEDHVLVAYNVATGARRKSSVRVDDPARVFLR